MGKKEDKKAEDILNEDVEAGAKAAAAAAEEVEAAENENAVPEDGVGIEQAAADIIAKMQQQEATITTLEDQVKRQSLTTSESVQKEKRQICSISVQSMLLRSFFQSLITLREVSKLYLKVKKQQDLLREWRWFTSR